MKSRLTILAAAAVLAAMSLASCQKVYLGDIEDRLGRLEETVDSLCRIQTGVQTISREMKSLADSVSALRERVSTQGSGADASRVQALEESVRNLQTWASSLDGIGAAIEGINTALATHSDSLSTLDASLRGADAAISALQAQVEAVQSALEAASQDPGSGAAVDGLIARVNSLEPKVSTLESTVATLQEALSSLIGRVDSMELELAGIDDQIAGIGTTIADLRTAVEALQASSASSSAQAQTAIAALEARIAALEQLQESLATKEWAEGTFATLAAQQQTAADLAGVQAAVAAALAGMPEGKTVTEAIDAASQSVQDWVNEKLAGYCTIGTIEGKLSAMKTELAAQVAALGNKADSLDDALNAKIAAANAEIAALNAALDAAKTEITTAYTNAINSAKAALEQDIADLDGRITVNTAAINAANSNITTLDGEVTDLGTDVADLQSSLAEVVDRLEKLETMVQSVVFVPRYKGGSAVVKSLSEISSFTLDYEVLPRKAGKTIADSWSGDNSILGVTYRQVATRAGLPTLDIKNVAFDASDSLLNVTVSFANVTEILLSSDRALAVSLMINTGATMVSSPFTDIDNGLEFENLSAGGTANCYIVKEAGAYKFNATVRGNGKDTDGNDAAPIVLTDGASAKVLWESFGTDDAVNRGDLVSDAIYAGGNVLFETPETFKRGNAVIAVTDGDNKILWSWHIWLTDEPQEQVYKNNAGTMMDRNLGATSAEKGNPGALGLLYQWGRKDPFLGSSAIDSGTEAKSYPDGITEFKSVSECIPSGSTNSLDYSIAYPSTFIKGEYGNFDWYCTAGANKNLWKIPAASGSPKTMYDPCPPGWRVPDGGAEGVWAKAFGTSGGWIADNNWDGAYKGMDFGRTDKPLGSGMIWYPAAGSRGDGSLACVGDFGSYWSCTIDDNYSYGFDSFGNVGPSYHTGCSCALSVRCLSESR